MLENINIVREFQYSKTESIDLITSIKSVEINPIEACTRRCTFCPRSNPSLYPTTHNKISLETCTKISKDLSEINYIGRVGFVGFGEPLLHKELEDCIKIIKSNNTNISFIEVITNGDLLTRKRIESLYNAGCNLIVVSMYDKDISADINTIKGNIPIDIVFRHHYDSKNNFNLNLVNRKEIAFNDTKLNIKSPCYIPFYKLMIDWNGDVLTCQNDWSRTITFGNINNTSIREIWLGEQYNTFKRTLAGGKRTIDPCSKCNVCGITRGEKEFNIFTNYLSGR